MFCISSLRFLYLLILILSSFHFSNTDCLCTLCEALRFRKIIKRSSNRTVSVIRVNDGKNAVNSDNLRFMRQPDFTYPAFEGIIGCQKIRAISRGAYGRVLLVKMVNIYPNQFAALKIFDTMHIDNCEKERAILEYIAMHETNIGRKLQIAHIRKSVHGGSCPYLMLEYIDGFDLDDKILGRYSFAILLNFVKHLMNQIGFGVLKDLHSLNIYHNDLKPNNIMFAPNAQKFHLIDFGLSVPLSFVNEARFQTVTFFTTITFMSPWHLKLINQSGYVGNFRFAQKPLDNAGTRLNAKNADFYSLALTIIRIMGRFCRGDDPFCAVCKWIFSIQQSHFDAVSDRNYSKVNINSLEQLFNPYWKQVHDIFSLYVSEHFDECADENVFFLSTLSKWLNL